MALTAQYYLAPRSRMTYTLHLLCARKACHGENFTFSFDRNLLCHRSHVSVLKCQEGIPVQYFTKTTRKISMKEVRSRCTACLGHTKFFSQSMQRTPNIVKFTNRQYGVQLLQELVQVSSLENMPEDFGCRPKHMSTTTCQ